MIDLFFSKIISDVCIILQTYKAKYYVKMCCVT